MKYIMSTEVYFVGCLYITDLLTARKIDRTKFKMELQEAGWGSMDWIELAQDRDMWRALVNTVMNLRVP